MAKLAAKMPGGLAADAQGGRLAAGKSSPEVFPGGLPRGCRACAEFSGLPGMGRSAGAWAWAWAEAAGRLAAGIFPDSGRRNDLAPTRTSAFPRQSHSSRVRPVRSRSALATPIRCITTPSMPPRSRFGRLLGQRTANDCAFFALTASHFSKRGAMLGLEFWVRFRRPVYADETITLEWLVVSVKENSAPRW